MDVDKEWPRRCGNTPRHEPKEQPLTKSSLVDLVHNDQSRLGRAVRLFEEHGDEIEDLGDGIYNVPSSTGTGSYPVNYTNESCSCPDAEFHTEDGFACKH